MSIVLPVDISFADWVATLQVDYSTDEVPMYFTEDNWREFADYTKRLNTFSNDDIPGHDGFNDWRDWAQRLAQTLNG